MSKTDPLDPNVPAGSEDPKLGNDRIQELAKAVAELLAVNHYMGTDGGAGVGYNEDAAGEHTKIKFNAPISTPTYAANKLYLYGKDVGGKIELHILDEDGNEVQLSSAGKVYAPNLLMPSGGVAQIETVRAVDATGLLLQNDTPATVITIGDDGVATLADGSKLATSAAPDADAELANKKYVDDSVLTPNPAVGSNESEGYVNFNSGLQMRWGQTSIDAGSQGTVTFGTAFSNACFQVVITRDGTSGNYYAGRVDEITASSFKIWNPGGATMTFHWFAIGR